MKKLWPPENVWDEEQMEASSSPTAPCLLLGLSVGRTLSRPTGHKVAMPTILSLIRDTTATLPPWGGGGLCRERDHPQGQPLASPALGQISGGLQHQHTSVKGLEAGALGTSGGGRCHGLRWPDGQGQRDHGGGQRTWGMLGLGCWAPCSF